VAITGSYVFIADFDSGLRVVDVSNLARPAKVGSYATPDARGVAVTRSHVYLADEYGLRVIDVSDPAYPTAISSYLAPDLAQGVAVARSYAYVADGGSGLRVVDVSDPTHPTEVGFYDTPGLAEGVAVAGGYAYIADHASGLLILHYTEAGTSHTVSGQVRNASNNPIPGVRISAGSGHTATTDSKGTYTLSRLAAGAYTLKPSKAGYSFTPTSRTVSVPPDATGVDFSGISPDLELAKKYAPIMSWMLPST